MGFLYRNIGFFFSYIGNIGNIGGSTHPGLESRDQQGLIRIIPSDANTLVDIKGIGFTSPLLTIDRNAFSHLKALHSLKMYGCPKVDCIDVNGSSASFNALL